MSAPAPIRPDLPHQAPSAPPTPAPSPGAQARIDFLRRAAARARALPGDDLFRACRVLGAEDDPRTAEQRAVALFQVLPSVLGARRLRWYQPGAAERSFDEDWLLSALAAAARGDGASLTFLLGRRLPRHARRQVAFLLQNLSGSLDTVA